MRVVFLHDTVYVDGHASTIPQRDPASRMAFLQQQDAGRRDTEDLEVLLEDLRRASLGTSRTARDGLKKALRQVTSFQQQQQQAVHVPAELVASLLQHIGAFLLHADEDVRIVACKTLRRVMTVFNTALNDSTALENGNSDLQKGICRSTLVFLMLQLASPGADLRLAALEAMLVLPQWDVEIFVRSLKVPTFRYANDDKMSTQQQLDEIEPAAERWYGALFFTLDDESALVRKTVLEVFRHVVGRRQFKHHKMMEGCWSRLGFISSMCLVDHAPAVRKAAAELLIELMRQTSVSIIVPLKGQKNTADTVTAGSIIQCCKVDPPVAFEVMGVGRYADSQALEAILQFLLDLDLGDDGTEICRVLQILGRKQAQLLKAPSGMSCVEKGHTTATAKGKPRLCTGLAHRLHKQIVGKAKEEQQDIGISLLHANNRRMERLRPLLLAAVEQVPSLRTCVTGLDITTADGAAASSPTEGDVVLDWCQRLDTCYWEMQEGRNSSHPSMPSRPPRKPNQNSKPKQEDEEEKQEKLQQEGEQLKALRRATQGLLSLRRVLASMAERHPLESSVGLDLEDRNGKANTAALAGHRAAIAIWVEVLLCMCSLIRSCQPDAHPHPGEPERKRQRPCHTVSGSSAMHAAQRMHLLLSYLALTFRWPGYEDASRPFPQALVVLRLWSLGAMVAAGIAVQESLKVSVRQLGLNEVQVAEIMAFCPPRGTDPPATILPLPSLPPGFFSQLLHPNSSAAGTGAGDGGPRRIRRLLARVEGVWDAVAAAAAPMSEKKRGGGGGGGETHNFASQMLLPAEVRIALGGMLGVTVVLNDAFLDFPEAERLRLKVVFSFQNTVVEDARWPLPPLSTASMPKKEGPSLTAKGPRSLSLLVPLPSPYTCSDDSSNSTEKRVAVRMQVVLLVDCPSQEPPDVKRRWSSWLKIIDDGSISRGGQQQQQQLEKTSTTAIAADVYEYLKEVEVSPEVESELLIVH